MALNWQVKGMNGIVGHTSYPSSPPSASSGFCGTISVDNEENPLKRLVDTSAITKKCK